MKKISLLIIVALMVSLLGCSAPSENPQIVATTKPVYDFTSRLCSGTGLVVGQLITESVSCLHDYSLTVRQMRNVEAAEVIVISGGGLEEFMEDLLAKKNKLIDSSLNIPLSYCGEDSEHTHDHAHEADAHFWLSPSHATTMAENIFQGLCRAYPTHSEIFQSNYIALKKEIEDLQNYGKQQLSGLAGKELITFHDGFGYLAEEFNLHILRAVEEESGSEASAKELMELTNLVTEHHIQAIFTERNGSTSAAEIIARETGISVYVLNMGMGEGDYFEIMRQNFDTLKEALG